MMLAYCYFFFSAKTHFLNCCDLMLFLNLCMYVYSFTGILELDDSDDCVEPTRECRRICNNGVPFGCSLRRVGEVGISRGKCHHCLEVGRCPVHHTTFACSFCKVRL